MKIPKRREVKLNLSLMYRRSANTYLSYPPINNGDTIHFYKRSGSRAFRVYSISLSGQEAKVNSLIISSYQNNRLLQVTSQYAKSTGSIVDTYAEPTETIARVQILYIPKRNDNVEQVFTFYINPDKPIP